MRHSVDAKTPWDPSAMTSEHSTLASIEEKISQTWNMLDYYGVRGALSVCFLPDGSTQFSSMGRCLDARGGALGVYAGLTAVRNLAQEQGEEALAALLEEAIGVLSPLAQPHGQGGQRTH